MGGRYLLGELVGIGGMATVHRAFDTKFDRSVAVKLLRREIIEDLDIAMRFRREALAATVLRHPNIVACLEAGTDDGQPYLVMELVEGEDLAARLRRVGRLDPPEAARIGLDAARGLAVAHVRGIVHRDVKPGNILLARDGRAMVTDFGIARLAADAEGAIPGTTLGSVQYFSPEQARGATTTAASDVYGVGLVLYEALTGRRAWRADTTAALAAVRIGAPAPSPRAVRPEIPATLDEVVVRALDPDPSARYPNGGALAAALAQIVGQPDPVSPAVFAATPAIAAGGGSSAPAPGIRSGAVTRGGVVAGTGTAVAAAAVGDGGIGGAAIASGAAGAVDDARSTPSGIGRPPATPLAVGASSAVPVNGAHDLPPASVGSLAAPLRPSNGAFLPSASSAASPPTPTAGRTVISQPRASRRPPPAVAAPLAVLVMVVVVVGGALFIAAMPQRGDAGVLAAASGSASARPSVRPTATPRPTPAATPTPKPTPARTPKAAATPRPASGPGTPDLCGPIFGLACALDAGRYAPAVFEPAIRFDLRDGWSTASQSAELLVLGRREGSLTFASGIDTVYPTGDPAKAPGTARALVEVFITTDGVASGDPSDRKVDKRRTRVVDVWPSGRGRLPLFGAGAQVYFLEPSGPTRVMVVDGPDGTLILTIEASDGSALEDIWPSAKRVIDSIRFR